MFFQVIITLALIRQVHTLKNQLTGITENINVYNKELSTLNLKVSVSPNESKRTAKSKIKLDDFLLFCIG